MIVYLQKHKAALTGNVNWYMPPVTQQLFPGSMLIAQISGVASFVFSRIFSRVN